MYESLVPLSFERHAGLRVRSVDSYAYTRRAVLAPVVPTELARAAIDFPLAFVREGESFRPAALLGLEPGRNLFVTPEGNWRAAYVPAWLRRYPFALVPVPGNGGRLAVCVDEASDLVGGDGGERLFGEDGRPSEHANRVMTFLRALEEELARALEASTALARHDVIVPWRIEVHEGGAARAVGDLFRIDEARLEALDDHASLDIRRAHALDLAYAQMISTARLPRLGALGRAHAEHERAAAVAQAADIEFTF